MRLQYLPATSSDIDIIYQQCEELILRYEDLSTIDCEKVLHWVRNKIIECIGSYTCVYLSGKKAGYFRFVPNNNNMELDDLYILPQFRGRGIGTTILQNCCLQTTQPIMLYVFTQNTRAITLYKRMGFHIQNNVSPTRCIMIRETL